MTSVSNGKDYPVPEELSKSKKEDPVFDTTSYRICKESIGTLRGNSITLAKILCYVDKNKIYLLGKYKSTAEFAKKEFDISKSTVSRLINVMRKFGYIADEEYNIPFPDIKETGIDDFDALLNVCPTGIYKIKEEYESYDYTKLAVMLKLEDSYLSKCKPEMSVRQINQIYDAQKKVKALEDIKNTQQVFNISASEYWYMSKDIKKLFKVARLQIRSPSELKLIDKFLKTEKYEEYTEDERISIFAVEAMISKFNEIIKKG